MSIIKAWYPESPFMFNGVLHYVEYTRNTVRNENGDTIKVPTGPCGLACYKNELVVACYDAHLLFFVNSGTTISIPYPNDITSDSCGNLLITSSAIARDCDPFKNTSNASGSLYYLDLAANLHKLEIDRPIHYANGIAFNNVTRQLYVSEHIMNRILIYELLTYTGDGIPILGSTKTHLQLPMCPHDNNVILGPDGLALDANGNLYIAHFGSSNVYVYNSLKCLLKTYVFDHAYVTNVCLSRNMMYVTVANNDQVGYVSRQNI